MLNPLMKVTRCFPKIRYRIYKSFLNTLASICGFLRLHSWQWSLLAAVSKITQEYEYNKEEHEYNKELARVMVEPIRRALDYQALGGRLVTMDVLPQGAIYGNPSNPNVHIATANFLNAAYAEYRGDRSYIMTTSAGPNIATETISTSIPISFGLSDFPYGEGVPTRFYTPYDEEESVLNDYLVWYAEQKLQKEIETRRKSVKSIIEIGE